MPAQIEQHFQCPYCGQTVSCLLDLSLEAQCYVEDCEVCCQPIDIAYESGQGTVTRFSAQRADG